MMRDYARSLDERLEEKAKYTDSWIDDKINKGFEVVATSRQPFLNEEVLDLNPYIIDGTKKIEVNLDEDVVGFKRIFTNASGGVEWVVNPDNTIHITLVTSSIPTTSENLFTVQYYYFPKAPTTETYMSSDIYHFVQHGIEFVIWEALRDVDKMNWAKSKLDDSARTVVNGLDIDVGPNEQWNGGFIL